MTYKPQAILFDLGNVLFDIDIKLCTKNIIALLREGIDERLFRNEFMEKNHALERGEISKELFLNFILKYSRTNVNALDVIEAWNSMLIGMPIKRLEWLRLLSKKYPLYLLSNINDFHHPKFKLLMYEDHGVEEFDDFFKEVYYSHLIGMRKPDAKTFEMVAKQIPFDTEKILFADDMEENVVSAREVGFTAVLIPEQNVKSIFDQIGI